ncbi:hypothetical protein AB4865_03670 [Capnocytophaga sp. ARDL2]|uniref:hypothetical protein n=1 Tax=Capnocytophaga sp. ARDL2 TaxID=3238809 RepID=UPI0035563158
MKALFILLFFPLINIFAQDYQYFLYESKQEQFFRIHPGRSDIMHYIYMDKGDIQYNSLFEIDEKTTKLIIPNDGFYEIQGTFSFSMNTGNLRGAKAGINFGFVKIIPSQEVYFAATRFSFEEKNQNEYVQVQIYPTIVYLEKGVVIAPALSTGLLNKPIVNAHLGTNDKTSEQTAIKWSIKLISNETAQQKYY